MDLSLKRMKWEVRVNEENDDVVADLMDIYDSGYVVTTDDVYELLEYCPEEPRRQIADPQNKEPRSEVVNKIRNCVAAIKQYGTPKDVHTAEMPVFRTDYTNNFQKQLFNKRKENNMLPHKNYEYRYWREDGPSEKLEIIQKAEAELTRLVLKQGYFTAKDVHDALGIKKEGVSKQTLDAKLFFDCSPDLTSAAKNAIRSQVENAYDSVYHNENLPNGLQPIKIWTTSNGYTTVLWNDSTKTTAKCEKPENTTEYGGFCACVAKKLYGSTSKSLNAMTKAIDNANWPAKQKQIERDKLKKLKQERHEHDIQAQKAEHEALVQREIEKIKAHAEAERRLKNGDVD